MRMAINGNFPRPRSLTRDEIKHAIESYLAESVVSVDVVPGSEGEYAVQARTGRGVLEFLVEAMPEGEDLSDGVEEVEFTTWPPTSSH
jgi:hypothetical protein